MRLLLIRHAKSSWRHPHLSDHDRLLNKRGQRDAPLMAQRLQQRFAQDLNSGQAQHPSPSNSNHPTIDVVFSSSAVRALSFAQHIADALAIPLMTDRRLYTFDHEALLTTLRQLPTHYQSVAVVGHNPAITDLANRLIKPTSAQTYIDNVPTSGMVALNCPIDRWQYLANDPNAGHCVLDYIDYPKRNPQHF